MTITERPAGWLPSAAEPGADGQWPAMHGIRVLDFTLAAVGRMIFLCTNALLVVE